MELVSGNPRGAGDPAEKRTPEGFRTDVLQMTQKRLEKRLKRTRKVLVSKDSEKDSERTLFKRLKKDIEN